MSLSDCSLPLFGGSLLVDNSAIDVRQCGYALFGGPFVITGSSIISSTVVASGGAVAGGVSAYSKRVVYPTSQGSVAGGSATFLQSLHFIPTNGIVTGGALLDLYYSEQATAYGGTVIGGIATVSTTHVAAIVTEYITVLGGVVVGGNAGVSAFSTYNEELIVSFSCGYPTLCLYIAIPKTYFTCRYPSVHLERAK